MPPMAQQPPADAAMGAQGRGLRFLNRDWNDSISNGHPFTVTWNQSPQKPGAQLGLFKVRYPKDGVVVFDLVSNLTDPTDSVSYEWTPEHLENDLYSVWLSDGEHAYANWTMSPPWTPRAEESKSGVHWALPIGIPIACLLVLYAVFLTIYLLHRRRHSEKREKEDATPHRDVRRHHSAGPASSVQKGTKSTDASGSKLCTQVMSSPPGVPRITTKEVSREEGAADTPISRATTLVAQSPV